MRPDLTYHMNTEPGQGLVPVKTDAPNLFSVDEVTVWMQEATGVLIVFAQGPMRKLDGTQGGRRRSAALVPDPEVQPAWLARVLRDADRRLRCWTCSAPLRDDL